MEGAHFRSAHEVIARDDRNGPGGQGGNQGHGGGSGNGHAGGGGGGEEGEGGGAGNGNGGGDDKTSTVVASTTAETATAAVAITTSESATVVESSAQAKTSETTSTTAAKSSDSAALPSTTATVQGTSTGLAGSEETGGSSKTSSNESTSVELGAIASQTTSVNTGSTTAAKTHSETSSGAVSALSATSSASPSSSSNSNNNSASHSSSHAGVIAGVIVGVLALIAIGFILYRLRRTRSMRHLLAPFHKTTGSQTGPYQNIEKPDVGMAPNMTGETLVGIKSMRATGPNSPLPKNNVQAGGMSASTAHLTLETEYLGPATVRTVSPVSPMSDLAPEVSPVSSSSGHSNTFPLQPTPFPVSNTIGPGRAVSVAGSEARIVSIPPRSSKTSTTSVPPASSTGLKGGRPHSPRRDRLGGRTPGPSKSFTADEGSGEEAWRPSRQQRPSAPRELRPPPLSINRSRQVAMWAQYAPGPAAIVNNAGYRPYHPSIATKDQAPPRRVSRESVSGASVASSNVFSLTDAMSWPKPPSTPTASPDRH